MLDVMEDMTQAVREPFTMMGPWLDERTRRLWAPSEARFHLYGFRSPAGVR